MKAVIIVPARMQASRFPGKMLAPLAGRPVVAYTVQAARAVAGVEAVFVATDDALIAEAARTAGVRSIMTDPACRNGTERVAQAPHGKGRLDLLDWLGQHFASPCPVTAPESNSGTRYSRM